MGAILHSINPNHSQSTAVKSESPPALPFERLAELGLPRMLNHIAQLEAENVQLRTEVQALREALAQAEHQIICHRQLLRNSLIREQELRTELAHRW